MAELMPMIHAERATLADYFDALPDPEWTSPTWCDEWNVQQVAGHLIAAAHITFPHFFGGFVRSGFSFDRFVDRDLQTYATGTPTEVRTRFREIITSTHTPPGPKYVALGEVMVHGEDVRRSHGSKGDHPAEHLVTLADLYKKTGAPLHGKRRTAGLRMTATDVDWHSGDGPEVRGPCMSLILAMVGRSGALDDLEGDGLDVLQSRSG
jgi:uncharacterized protein (TIGR03083 family)